MNTPMVKGRMRFQSRLPVAILTFSLFANANATVKQDEMVEAGRQAYEASDYGKAAKLLQEAIAKDPRNGEVHLLLAKTYYESKQRDAAIASAEKAVAIAPDNSQYHEWLGKTYGEKADHSNWFSAISLAKKARNEFEKATRLDSRNFAARQALIEFDCSAPGLVGGGEEKARPEIAELAAMDAAEGHYAEGNCRRQKKDYAAADDEFTKALESHPHSINLVYDIGDYAVKRNQPGRLLVVASLGESISSQDPRGMFYRAVSFVMTKNGTPEAERLLRDYLQRAPVRDGYPSRSAAHDWLGRLYEAEGKTPMALEEYRTAQKLDEKNKNAADAVKRLNKN
jgi:tetratricopeptide (TPR) repeat protein